jgi:hypothetical protein
VFMQSASYRCRMKINGKDQLSGAEIFHAGKLCIRGEQVASMDNKVSHTRGKEEAARFSPPWCPRCRGLMYLVSYGDWGDPHNTQPVRAWNCIHCGEMVDPVILANRHQGLAPARRPYRARLPTGC